MHVGFRRDDGLLRPLASLCHQSFDQSGDQLLGDRLSEGKLGRAFAGQIRSDLRLDARVELRHWVDADVLLPTGEVDDRSAGEAEGRNRVTDRLLGTWSRGMNRAARCLEFGLHLGREACYVVVDGVELLRHSV